MESNSPRTFFLILFLLVIFSIFFAYIRIFVNGDYSVSFEVSCDHEDEKCFFVDDSDEVSYVKVLILNRSFYSNLCQNDLNYCVSSCANNPEMCRIITCEDADAKIYGKCK